MALADFMWWDQTLYFFADAITKQSSRADIRLILMRGRVRKIFDNANKTRWTHPLISTIASDCDCSFFEHRSNYQGNFVAEVFIHCSLQFRMIKLILI